MCTVGGGPDIGNIESLVAKDYECLDCKNQFKGMGRRLNHIQHSIGVTIYQNGRIMMSFCISFFV